MTGFSTFFTHRDAVRRKPQQTSQKDQGLRLKFSSYPTPQATFYLEAYLGHINYLQDDRHITRKLWYALGTSELSYKRLYKEKKCQRCM